MSNETAAAAQERAMVAFIACAGDAAGRKRHSECESCVEAVENGSRRGECKSGCVGVGDCAKICPIGAIVMKNGHLVVDREKCDGCGKCVDACPRELIRMIPKDATNFIPCSSAEDDEETVRETCVYGCISCGQCERVCKEDAVHVINNHAVIDYDKCVGCNECALKCRKKIIVDTRHDIRALKSKVAFVRCAGDGRIAAKLKSVGIQTCGEAALIDMKEMGLCTTGCYGLGKCTTVCRFDAIHIENGVARVDPDHCVGCKACTYICPKKLITIEPYKNQKVIPCSSVDTSVRKEQVCSTGCLFCQDCVRNCPNDAIYMDGTHTIIDPDRCEDCHVCQYICSRGIIRDMEVPQYIYEQRQAILGKEAK